MEKVKVGINGYGVIGKRIADAILLQDDMELVGVTARTPDYRLFSANKKGIKVFGVDPEACNRLMNSGVKCNGDFNHFIKRVDVVIDATPAGIGKENKVKYDTAKVKSIFQGGEEHELTGFSFVSEVRFGTRTGRSERRAILEEIASQTSADECERAQHSALSGQSAESVCGRRSTPEVPWPSGALAKEATPRATRKTSINVGVFCILTWDVGG